jgi:hypothetical protein
VEMFCDLDGSAEAFINGGACEWHKVDFKVFLISLTSGDFC